MCVKFSYKRGKGSAEKCKGLKIYSLERVCNIQSRKKYFEEVNNKNQFFFLEKETAF